MHFIPQRSNCERENRHINFIRASLSEPHTNRYYEKIAVLMYVCVYPRYVVHVLYARTCGSAHTNRLFDTSYLFMF